MAPLCAASGLKPSDAMRPIPALDKADGDRGQAPGLLLAVVDHLLMEDGSAERQRGNERRRRNGQQKGELRLDFEAV
jgi:hypothetical protein